MLLPHTHFHAVQPRPFGLAYLFLSLVILLVADVTRHTGTTERRLAMVVLVAVLGLVGMWLPRVFPAPLERDGGTCLRTAVERIHHREQDPF
jgi:uncharacterized membrane protein